MHWSVEWRSRCARAYFFSLFSCIVYVHCTQFQFLGCSWGVINFGNLDFLTFKCCNTYFWNRFEPQMEKHPIPYRIDRPPSFFHRPDSAPMGSSGNKCMARIVCHRKTLTDRRQSMFWPPQNTLPNNRTLEHTLYLRYTLIRKLIL